MKLSLNTSRYYPISLIDILLNIYAKCCLIRLSLLISPSTFRPPGSGRMSPGISWRTSGPSISGSLLSNEMFQRTVTATMVVMVVSSFSLSPFKHGKRRFIWPKVRSMMQRPRLWAVLYRCSAGFAGCRRGVIKYGWHPYLSEQITFIKKGQWINKNIASFQGTSPTVWVIISIRQEYIQWGIALLKSTMKFSQIICNKSQVSFMFGQVNVKSRIGVKLWNKKIALVMKTISIQLKAIFMICLNLNNFFEALLKCFLN